MGTIVVPRARGASWWLCVGAVALLTWTVSVSALAQVVEPPPQIPSDLPRDVRTALEREHLRLRQMHQEVLLKTQLTEPLCGSGNPPAESEWCARMQSDIADQLAEYRLALDQFDKLLRRTLQRVREQPLWREL